MGVYVLHCLATATLAWCTNNPHPKQRSLIKGRKGPLLAPLCVCGQWASQSSFLSLFPAFKQREVRTSPSGDVCPASALQLQHPLAGNRIVLSHLPCPAYPPALPCSSPFTDGRLTCPATGARRSRQDKVRYWGTGDDTGGGREPDPFGTGKSGDGKGALVGNGVPLLDTHT